LLRECIQFVWLSEEAENYYKKHYNTGICNIVCSVGVETKI